MKTVIIYATKYGATKKIAEKIAGLFNNAVLHDINSNNAVCIKDYDCVILGSPLTAGMVNGKIKKFAAEQIGDLKSKKSGIFLSGLQTDGETEYFKQNFSQVLLDSVTAKAFLGGIFDPEKCGFFARKIIKAAAKFDSYTNTIDEAKINEFVHRVTEN